MNWFFIYSRLRFVFRRLTVFRRSLMPLAGSVAQSVQWLGQGLENGRIARRTTFGRFKRYLFYQNGPYRLWIPPSLLLNGWYQRLFTKGKAARTLSWPISGPSTTEVNNAWSYTTSPFWCLNGICRDRFTLLPLPLQLYNLDFDTAQSATWLTFRNLASYI